jgi:hypothetical protein
VTPADAWATAADPWRLLAALPDPLPLRKVRLAAVGYRRHYVRQINSDSLLDRLEIAECVAGREEPEEVLELVEEALSGDAACLVRGCVVYDQWTPEQTRHGSRNELLMERFDSLDREAAVLAGSLAAGPASADVHPGHPWHAAFQLGFTGFAKVKADIVRCVFGNPFRPVAFAPDWRTDTALGLARAIHEDHAFDRLPILADALEDAGCTDADVLGHCRGGGPHARGCWVVDLVLGRG